MEYKNDIPQLGFFGRIGMALVRAFSRLPLGFLYLLSDFVYLILYKIASYRVKVVRENLLIAFPDKSRQELKAIEKAFYHHLCDYFFETVKALTISDDELRRRYVIKNPELVQQIADSGQSVFLYGAHIGNWEWLTALPLYFPNVPVHTFYQKQSSVFADHMTLSVRTRRGIIAVESHKGFRHEVSCKADKYVHMTLVLGDQCPHYAAKKFWFDFFGKDTPFLVGPSHIASKLNVALVYPSYTAYRRGYYEVEMKLIELNPKDIEPIVACQRFAALLTDDLYRIPQIWLWSHRRWKLHHEDFPGE
ncbi:MAG: lysophospholipid acyltransferase family protein [Bacteroidales bacterium]|nr:lysophospholipid acyltransferase family protein [Bacteroidales bacterium]